MGPEQAVQNESLTRLRLSGIGLDLNQPPISTRPTQSAAGDRSGHRCQNRTGMDNSIDFAGTRSSLVERVQGRIDVLKQALNLIALFGTDFFLQPLD
jgi:hypothetical protein